MPRRSSRRSSRARGHRTAPGSRWWPPQPRDRQPAPRRRARGATARETPDSAPREPHLGGDRPHVGNGVGHRPPRLGGRPAVARAVVRHQRQAASSRIRHPVVVDHRGVGGPHVSQHHTRAVAGNVDPQPTTSPGFTCSVRGWTKRIAIPEARLTPGTWWTNRGAVRKYRCRGSPSRPGRRADALRADDHRGRRPRRRRAGPGRHGRPAAGPRRVDVREDGVPARQRGLAAQGDAARAARLSGAVLQRDPAADQPPGATPAT